MIRTYQKPDGSQVQSERPIAWIKENFGEDIVELPEPEHSKPENIKARADERKAQREDILLKLGITDEEFRILLGA